MRKQLEELVQQGKSVIVDAPFFYEDEEDFLRWLDPLNEKMLVVSLYTNKDERKRRRQSRGFPRDRVSDWTEVLEHEETTYRPLLDSLLLSGEADLHVLEDIVVWYLQEEGKEIREANENDLEKVWHLKKEILEETFSAFLYPDELADEVRQVASKEAVKKLLRDNEVVLAEKDNVPWAMLAVSPREEDKQGKKFRKIFSGYSKGEHAAAAIGAGIVSSSGDLDYLLAWVYRDNEQSKHVLGSFGFEPLGDSHENPEVPRVPVEHWWLDLRR